MKIGVVSDTHGHVTNTLAAVNLLSSLKVEHILHCGDIGTPTIPRLFTNWPTDFVFGNCDHPREELAAAIAEAGHTCHGEFGELKLAGKQIALLHGDDHRKFQEVTTNGRWDLVCYGHTHVAKIDRIGPTVVLNPGALYRANPHSFAVVDLTTMKTAIVKL